MAFKSFPSLCSNVAYTITSFLMQCHLRVWRSLTFNLGFWLFNNIMYFVWIVFFLQLKLLFSNCWTCCFSQNGKPLPIFACKQWCNFKPFHDTISCYQLTCLPDACSKQVGFFKNNFPSPLFHISHISSQWNVHRKI